MRAYEFIKPSPRFRAITRQTCRWLVPATTRELDGRYRAIGLFIADRGLNQLPIPVDELTDVELEKLRNAWMKVTADYPFVPFFERVRSAQRACNGDGDYAATVLAAYTACEILFNTVLLLMAWEEGRTRQETRVWFEARLQFTNRVAREVQPRLGGNWANPSETSPMTQILVLSDVRQKVAHIGYLPKERQARTALDALATLEDFVKTRLAARRRDYPRSSLLLNGKPGLQRRGCWDSWMKRWLNDQAEAEAEWGVAFREWRDSLN